MDQAEEMDEDEEKEEQKHWPEIKRQGGVDNAFQTRHRDQIAERYHAGQRAFGVWATVGSGKSGLVFCVMEFLRLQNDLSRHVLWLTPGATIPSLLAEGAKYGVRMRHWAPIKNGPKGSVSDLSTVPPGTVLVLAHDHARKVPDEAVALARRSLVVIDELHKLHDKGTQRAAILTRLLREARLSIWLTGTAIAADDVAVLCLGAQSVCGFPVCSQNVMAACAHLAVHAASVDVPASFLHSTIPPDRSLDEELVARAAAYAADAKSGGAVVMARDGKHAHVLLELFAQRHTALFAAGAVKKAVGTPAEAKKDKTGRSLCGPTLTAENQSSVEPLLRVLIVPLSLGEGINLQRFNVSIEFEAGGAWFKCEQFRGRVRRPGQTRPVIFLKLVRNDGREAFLAARAARAESLAGTFLEGVGKTKTNTHSH
jgi:hypothetical protein